MNVRDETRHDIHKSAALRYALLCIVTRLISDVHFHITEEIQPSVKNWQCPLQIFDTQVDLPVPLLFTKSWLIIFSYHYQSP